MSHQGNDPYFDRLSELYTTGWITAKELADAGDDMDKLAALMKEGDDREAMFDPDEYKTWPDGYMGMLIDRAKDEHEYA